MAVCNWKVIYLVKKINKNSCAQAREVRTFNVKLDATFSFCRHLEAHLLQCLPVSLQALDFPQQLLSLHQQRNVHKIFSLLLYIERVPAVLYQSAPVTRLQMGRCLGMSMIRKAGWVAEAELGYFLYYSICFKGTIGVSGFPTDFIMPRARMLGFTKNPRKLPSCVHRMYMSLHIYVFC